MASSLYGCSEKVDNPKYVVSEIKPETTISAETEIVQKVSGETVPKKKPEVTKASEKPKKEVIINESEYPYSEDIMDSNVSAMKNSDGTIRLTFLEGKFALTLPEKLENHFIIKDGHLSSKIYFNENNGEYSKMACFSFSESADSYDPDTTVLLGRSGSTYMWSICSKDSDYKPTENAKAKTEFDLIEGCLKEIYASAESNNEKTNKMGKILDVSDSSAFKGELIADCTTGFTEEDYQYGNDIVSRTAELPLEQGLGVTAKKAVSMYEGTYFDCYNSADGTHYGWICDKKIRFFITDK